MSIIRLPDPHPGRCPNLRPSTDANGYPVMLRCLGYANRPHRCVFPEPVAVRLASHTSWTSATTPKPGPWVSPLDDEPTS